MYEQLVSLGVLTLRSPREAAQLLKRNTLPTYVWLMFAAVIILTLNIVSGVMTLVMPPPQIPDGVDKQIMDAVSGFDQPFVSVLIQFFILGITIGAVHWVSGLFGGVGTLHQSLVFVTWHAALSAVLQIGLLVLALALPGLAGLLLIGLFLWLIWVFASLLAETYGFVSVGSVIGVIFAVVFAILLGTAFIASMFLVQPVPA